MKKNKVDEIFGIVSHNFSFKLVSLIIAMILWIAVLGRRDFVVTKALEVDIILSPNSQIVNQSTERVKVKISGPRAAVRKFVEGGYSQFITLDLSNKESGKYTVNLEGEKFDIPFGSRLLSVQPKEIEIEIGASK